MWPRQKACSQWFELTNMLSRLVLRLLRCSHNEWLNVSSQMHSRDIFWQIIINHICILTPQIPLNSSSWKKSRSEVCQKSLTNQSYVNYLLLIQMVGKQCNERLCLDKNLFLIHAKQELTCTSSLPSKESLELPMFRSSPKMLSYISNTDIGNCYVVTLNTKLASSTARATTWPE